MRKKQATTLNDSVLAIKERWNIDKNTTFTIYDLIIIPLITDEQLMVIEYEDITSNPSASSSGICLEACWGELCHAQKHAQKIPSYSIARA